ncbi:fatty acid desaturase [Parahaliea maris]|uniref:Fatty acid desaturase n=1 Tax=Parahaliea maris TaxID=2716870 RepID=A0A5C8ZSR6_9GAMM|nr:fatty acid desaturase [Parahaliea maris]TXS90710.1 fatty acid desaturase [Parahaliea maris]
MHKATEQQRIKVIQDTIRSRGQELRQTYPILQHQDAIGLGIFLFAVAGVLATGWAYWHGHISAWLTIPLVALFTSLLHELEHDLIHIQYFRRQKWVQNLMLMTAWILRPGTINPWVRRKLHFLHHKVSGTPEDLEERGIGNGQRYGIVRTALMLDTFTGNLVRALFETPRGGKMKHALRILRANMPVSVACAVVWYGFLGFHGANAAASVVGSSITWSDLTLANMAWINKLVVILIAPHYLRSFCINFISSSMHYYGGVTSVLQQTQVLNAWFLWPMQLFCFNFGSTHGIHHFVVGEPFYIRQLTAPVAHRVMRDNGVRFNDLGTFSRANHFPTREIEDLAGGRSGQPAY